jgi:hypothetical protein
VIGAPSRQEEGVPLAVADDLLAESFGQLTEDGGMNRRQALREAARQHGVSARQVFDALERRKSSVE